MFKPNFDRRVVLNENLAVVNMFRTKLKFDKPIYFGACIIDIIKLLTVSYGRCDNVQLLFTDTDSLAYEIQTEDFNKDITPHVQEKIDTSHYPANYPSGFHLASIRS